MPLCQSPRENLLERDPKAFWGERKKKTGPGGGGRESIPRGKDREFQRRMARVYLGGKKSSSGEKDRGIQGKRENSHFEKIAPPLSLLQPGEESDLKDSYEERSRNLSFERSQGNTKNDKPAGGRGGRVAVQTEKDLGL